MIADYFLQESMMMPDVFKEELGNSSGVQGGDCEYGVDPLRQVVHHHWDSIVSFQVREFSNHVYGDHLPVSIRDLVGDQLPHLLCMSTHQSGVPPHLRPSGLSPWGHQTGCSVGFVP